MTPHSVKDDPNEDMAKSTNSSPETGVGVSKNMEKEEAAMLKQRQKLNEKRNKELEDERKQDLAGGSGKVDQKFKALEFLLSQSKLYSTIMLQQMQKQEEKEIAKDEKGRKKAQKREEMAEKAAESSQRKVTRSAAAGGEDGQPKTQPSLKRGNSVKLKKSESNTSTKVSDFFDKKELQDKAGRATIQEALAEEAKDQPETSEIGMQDLRSRKQPDLVTGGLMRTYQLEGLDWLTSLYENGLNGILADEMGLGKTVQTISFLAFLREKGVYGPFLVAGPLSTTSNWVAEFQRWTPSIPVVLYHGSKAEREEIRRKKLRNPGSDTFPVICTSYEICMNDRKFLANFPWKFIIIDEGHRLKNLDCKLIRELQSYQSANRLLITGTPLQNNLTELWSLLHFLMPNIFDNLQSFESWFDFSALKEKGGHEQILSEERKKTLVSSLHAILKPFLLRRVKADVETSLPKKREYVLYAPLTTSQKELYQEILHGDSRAYLENKAFESLSGQSTPNDTRSRGTKRKAAKGYDTPKKSTKVSGTSTPASVAQSVMSRRSRRSTNYEELSDTQYFKQLESTPTSPQESELDSEEIEQRERDLTFALAKRTIASKKLQNPVLQLRLCCNSPHNFFYPFTAEDESDVDETLITESGKMMLLDRLLPELLSKNHKVLIFSQFKTQLDLIETYCRVLRQWTVCRIDGSIPQTERQEQILSFNDPSSDTKIFLLSTRAGGQGINLASADTVLLFDSDWNPQQDLQAQDRAHRIGQTRPVIVYRFATKNTVEQLLLEKAEGKRRLEKLVIQKGRFKTFTKNEEEDGNDEFEELQELLSKDDGQKLDAITDNEVILSREDLDVLTDRSEEAYLRAEKGLDGKSGGVFKNVETKIGGDGLLESLQK